MSQVNGLNFQCPERILSSEPFCVLSGHRRGVPSHQLLNTARTLVEQWYLSGRSLTSLFEQILSVGWVLSNDIMLSQTKMYPQSNIVTYSTVIY